MSSRITQKSKAAFVFAVAAVILAVAVSPAIAEGPPGSMEPVGCYRVPAHDLVSGDVSDLADITVCQRPLHDEQHPVFRNSVPLQDGFDYLSEDIDISGKAPLSDWEQAVALIKFN